MFDVFEKKNNRNFIVHTVSLQGIYLLPSSSSFLKRQISTHLYSLSTNLSLGTPVPSDSPFRLLSLYRTNFETPSMLHRH